MNFEDRLQKAIQRGQTRRAELDRQADAQAITEEEFRRLHSEYRLELSEHIETCLNKLPQHFPGFRMETLYGDRGWGAACFRDDFRVREGRRATWYSRLEVAVRPYSSAHVLELTAKGAIFNKEVFQRAHHEPLPAVDIEKFKQTVDLWVLEYVEQYAATPS